MQAAITQMAQAMATLATAVTTLTNTIGNNQATVNAAINSNKVTPFVEKPVPFKGKGSDSARLFRAAFRIYAEANKEKYALRHPDGRLARDAQTGAVLPDSQKWIVGALSFMQDEAADWARQYIEQAADNKVLFNGTRTNFWQAFKDRFEPVDENAEALSKLQACTQGNRRFAEFFAEFQALASHTKLSNDDLAARLRTKLNKDYLERISYMIDPVSCRGPETYDQLKNCCFVVDRSKDKLQQDLAAQQGVAELWLNATRGQGKRGGRRRGAVERVTQRRTNLRSCLY